MRSVEKLKSVEPVKPVKSAKSVKSIKSETFATPSVAKTCGTMFGREIRAFQINKDQTSATSGPKEYREEIESAHSSAQQFLLESRNNLIECQVECRAGDSILVQDAENESKVHCAIIVYLYEKDEKSMVHIRYFERGCDTIIGELASPRVLFLTSRCANIFKTEIQARIRVDFLGGGDKASNSAIDLIEEEYHRSPERYLYRLSYNTSLKSFPEAKEVVTQAQGSLFKECECCSVNRAKCEENHHPLKLLNWNKRQKSATRIMYEGTTYELKDFVCFIAKPTLGSKGLHPYSIGQIQNIRVTCLKVQDNRRVFRWKSELLNPKDLDGHCFIRHIHQIDDLNIYKDLDTPASKTFAQNFPEAIVYNCDAEKFLQQAIKNDAALVQDIVHDINGNVMPKIPSKGDIDMIVGGPPCQGWSRANRQNNPEKILENPICPRRESIATYLSFVEFYRPKYCFLENVEGLKHHPLNSTDIPNYPSDKGPLKDGAIKLIFRIFTGLGYQCQCATLVPLEDRADFRKINVALLSEAMTNESEKFRKNSGYRNMKYEGKLGRLPGNEAFKVITTGNDQCSTNWRLHPKLHRPYTIREIARAMGFPDDFKWDLKKTKVSDALKQMGNAVPVPFARALGKELWKVLQERDISGESENDEDIVNQKYFATDDQADQNMDTIEEVLARSETDSVEEIDDFVIAQLESEFNRSTNDQTDFGSDEEDERNSETDEEVSDDSSVGIDADIEDQEDLESEENWNTDEEISSKGDDDPESKSAQNMDTDEETSNESEVEVDEDMEDQDGQANLKSEDEIERNLDTNEKMSEGSDVSTDEDMEDRDDLETADEEDLDENMDTGEEYWANLREQREERINSGGSRDDAIVIDD
ncbi:hypothetical protein EAE96_007450 [Botrytis aclada]|nr:hypothetical protein EAE96_007450 [Botrytis aclada]